jgi:signal transduction histidine kinase
MIANYNDSINRLLYGNILDIKSNNNNIEMNILEAVIDNMTEELLIFDKDSKLIMLNKTVRDNPTYDLANFNHYSDIYNQVTFYDLKGNRIPFDEIPVERVLRGEKYTDYRLLIIVKDSGEKFYKEYSGTPIFDNYKNIIGGFILTRNIEEKIKNKENTYLKAQYDLLSKIIENLDLGFARYTYPDFKVIDINHKGYEQLKGLIPNLSSSAELKNMKLNDIFKGKVHVIEELINSSLKNNKTSHFRISKFKIAGDDSYVKWVYQPLLDISGNVIEVIIIGLDITKEIKEKNKMKEVLKIQDEIYSNVSHELKTPLNVIFSANQMMDIYLNKCSASECKEKLGEYNYSIKQNCYRLIKLINNIVDLSKSNSGLLKLEPMNVNIVDIVKTIVDSVLVYAKSKGLNIIFNSNVKEKIIACDVNLIERVMLNLISNAVKFSKTNGKIIVNVIDKSDYVEISVKDSGTGIKKKHIDFIFQRFYQADKSLSRNAEGSGIGLSLVKSIIELHGGDIKVESVLNEGSTFIVELPAKTINETKDIINANPIDNKVEMLKIEFSDIYAIE